MTDEREAMLNRAQVAALDGLKWEGVALLLANERDDARAEVARLSEALAAAKTTLAELTAPLDDGRMGGFCESPPPERVQFRELVIRHGALEAEAKRLREALAFYADPANHRRGPNGYVGSAYTWIAQDGGARARAALKGGHDG